MPPESVTQALSEMAMDLKWGDLPETVITVAKQNLLDVMAVSIVGAAEPSARIVQQFILQQSNSGSSTIVGLDRKTTEYWAALANGTAAHTLDYDDVAPAMGGHPTAPVFPAVLAIGESQGTSGKAFITAFVAGVETECRIAAAISPSHYERGFHTTSTVGSFGAAVAACHVLGATATTCEMALGIASTQASGLKSMFGTMCKPLNAGKAAAAGVLAARLAERGFTSAPDSIECAQGFAESHADSLDTRLARTAFGSPWYILDSLFKLHASCYFTHAAIEALCELRRSGAFDVSQTEAIEIRIAPNHLKVCDIVEPRTGLEAKFSLRFVAALALSRGLADETQFNDDTVVDQRLVSLRDRVRVVGDARMPQFSSAVTVRTKSGHTFHSQRDLGQRAWASHPNEQMSALLKKFHALVDPILGVTDASNLAAAICNLDELTDIRQLTALAWNRP